MRMKKTLHGCKLFWSVSFGGRRFFSKSFFEFLKPTLKVGALFILLIFWRFCRRMLILIFSKLCKSYMPFVFCLIRDHFMRTSGHNIYHHWLLRGQTFFFANILIQVAFIWWKTFLFTNIPVKVITQSLLWASFNGLVIGMASGQNLFIISNHIIHFSAYKFILFNHETDISL